MMKRTHFFPLLIFVGIAALLTFACGQPAPRPRHPAHLPKKSAPSSSRK